MESSSSSSSSPIPTSLLQSLTDIDNTYIKYPQVFKYGTAGFRFQESLWDKIAFRSAIMTCLLSMSKRALPYGIMITASHNKHIDNGIKIAGLNGEMLEQEYEPYYEQLINSSNLTDTINEIIIKLKISQQRSIIIIGQDTRASSPRLAGIMIQALQCFPHCESKNYNIITTPCLHFLTLVSQMAFREIGLKHKMIFPDEGVYWEFWRSGYKNFNIHYDKYLPQWQRKKYENSLTIDASYGLAAFVKDKISELMTSVSTGLSVSFINTDYHNKEELNNHCGGEFVQKERKYPVNNNTTSIKNLSFDGDVDRIIYYINDKSLTENIKIVDGDRLIVLFSWMLKGLITRLSKSVQQKFNNEISLGIITTAYANGAWMKYINNNWGWNWILAKTGVKFWHEKAKKFDIAVYFEANGHGTIHTSIGLKGKLDKLNCFIETSQDSQVLELIQYYVAMFNTTVGDAISSLIAVESCLRVLDWEIEDVYELYKELPAVNKKINVKDKYVFIPNENETRLIQPKEVQESIDSIVAKGSNRRCFIRPSGTEDVVRIYAEAEKLEDAQVIVGEIEEIWKSY